MGKFKMKPVFRSRVGSGWRIALPTFFLMARQVAMADLVGRIQLWVANPKFKMGAIIALGFLFFLIFLGAKAIQSRRRRF